MKKIFLFSITAFLALANTGIFAALTPAQKKATYALFMAIQNNDVQSVKEALKNKEVAINSDYNEVSDKDDNKYYGTPLMNAASHSPLKIVKLLVQAGANLNPEYAHGPLINAINYKKFDVANTNPASKFQ